MSDTTDWPGHPDADPDCECCLGDGLQADGETPCPCIDARRGSRAAQLTPDQYLLEGARAMQEAAARYIDKRLADYIKEHGTYDPTTGVTEFPGNGEEWTFEQEETAAAIRAINPTTVLAGATETPRAWLDVLGERVRQITVEGWTTEHDDTHVEGELAGAASAYAMSAAAAIQLRRDAPLRDIPPFFMFKPCHWEPTNARRDLVKAGALILAEIERLDRAADKEGQPQ